MEQTKTNERVNALAAELVNNGIMSYRPNRDGYYERIMGLTSGELHQLRNRLTSEYMHISYNRENDCFVTII